MTAPASLSYDALTLADAERMTDAEWQQLPRAVVNRLVAEYAGEGYKGVAEPSYPNLRKAAQITHEIRRTKRRQRTGK